MFDIDQIPKPAYQVVNIHPGSYHITSRPIQIKTLLGSCVAACLFDKTTGIAGMNHFLLSSANYSKKTDLFDSEAGRYGINAMELLINGMMKRGAIRQNIQAKVFGGANVLQIKNKAVGLNIGDINSEFVLKYLREEKIPVVAKALGGKKGRVIHFFTDNFLVLVRNLNKENRFLAQEETSYMKKALQARKERKNNIEFWPD